MITRVLFVTNMWPSISAPWLGTFVKTQVESLRYMGLEVDAFNIESRKSGGSNLSYLTAIFILFFRVMGSKYNCIHLQHWICWVVTLPIFWKDKVYTVHEGEFFLGGYRKFFINLAIKYSTRVIFVNRLMYEEYINRDGAPKNKYFFIPCGVDDTSFSKFSSRESRSTLNLSQDKKYIFFAACPKRKEKNAEFLIKWQSIYNSCPESNIEIIWGGSIDYELMPLWFAASNCTLTLGDYESDGMVVKESLACGTPVISFDVGNSSFYIESAACGKIIERDLPQLQLAIQDLINRDYYTNSLLNKSYNLVNTASTIVAVYLSLENK